MTIGTVFLIACIAGMVLLTAEAVFCATPDDEDDE